jgi:hypothetical protein
MERRGTERWELALSDFCDVSAFLKWNKSGCELSKRTNRISMKILFVHQNMPGQYQEMVCWLIRESEHEIMFLTQRAEVKIDEVVTPDIFVGHTGWGE